MVEEMTPGAKPGNTLKKLISGSLSRSDGAAADTEIDLDDVENSADADRYVDADVAEAFLRDIGVPTKEQEEAAEHDKRKAALKIALESFNKNNAEVETEKAIKLIATAYPEPNAEADVFIEELIRRRGDGAKKRTLGSQLTAERRRRKEDRQRRKAEVDASRHAANEVAAEASMYEALHALNESHAVLLIENTVKVMIEAPDKGVPSFVSADGFNLLKAPIKALSTFVDENGKQKTESKPVAPVWLRWKDRRTYHGITFQPYGVNERPEAGPTQIYNLWQGWQVTPRPGDWSLLRRHLFETVSHSNPYWFAWVMCWLSDLVQDPGVKKGTAIVVKGPPGAGKSLVADFVRNLIPNNSNSIAKKEQIVGRFNKHQAANLLTVGEEAFWAGDKQAEGVIKSMITDPTQMIEAKGVDAFQCPNFTRYWLCSNEDWVIPATDKDRRFMVLQIKEDHVGDFAYFGAIAAQMEKGGLEAMLYDLAQIKVPDWVQLRKPPRTPWLGEQIAESLPVTHQWFRETLEEGMMTYPANDQREPDVVVPLVEKNGVVYLDKTEAFKSFEAFARARGTRFVPSPAKFTRFMADMGAAVVRPRVREGSVAAAGAFLSVDRRRQFRFSRTLKELRAYVATRTGSYLVEELDEGLDQKHPAGPTFLGPNPEIDYSGDVPSQIDAAELAAWREFGAGGALPR